MLESDKPLLGVSSFIIQQHSSRDMCELIIWKIVSLNISMGSPNWLGLTFQNTKPHFEACPTFKSAIRKKLLKQHHFKQIKQGQKDLSSSWEIGRFIYWVQIDSTANKQQQKLQASRTIYPAASLGSDAKPIFGSSEASIVTRWLVVLHDSGPLPQTLLPAFVLGCLSTHAEPWGIIGRCY